MVIIKMTHALFPKVELEILMYTFPGVTHVMIESVGKNYQEIYTMNLSYVSYDINRQVLKSQANHMKIDE